jgi:hypothetical protein
VILVIQLQSRHRDLTWEPLELKQELVARCSCSLQLLVAVAVAVASMRGLGGGKL